MANLRSAPVEVRLWAKINVQGPEDCWEWTAGRLTRGYGAFKINGKQGGAHRAVWTITYGPIPPGMFVCHRCDNPPCCNPAHLFLATTQQNTADRDAKGRTATGDRSGARLHPESLLRGDANPSRKYIERRPRGSQHGMAKLSEDQVVKIRRERAVGVLGRVLAQRYGVTTTMIYYIANGKNWTHVT